MVHFDEYQSTNEYLISELVIARKENEVLTEHIETLVKHIETLAQDLKDCSKLLDAFVAYVS